MLSSHGHRTEPVKSVNWNETDLSRTTCVSCSFGGLALSDGATVGEAGRVADGLSVRVGQGGDGQAGDDAAGREGCRDETENTQVR